MKHLKVFETYTMNPSTMSVDNKLSPNEAEEKLMEFVNNLKKRPLYDTDVFDNRKNLNDFISKNLYIKTELDYIDIYKSIMNFYQLALNDAIQYLKKKDGY